VARFWPSPRHNVGIACGPSRLVVVDLDCHGGLPEEWRQIPGIRDGRDVLAQLCEWARQPWPVTYWTATPSGGWHLYFAAPEGWEIRNSAGLLAPQVDVRASGGYVVGAGMVGGKRYEVLDGADPVPLPAWITRMLTSARDRRTGEPAPGAITGRVAGLVRKVESAPEGQRNDDLYWAACRVAEMDSADRDAAVAALLDAAGGAGLSAREAWRSVRSALGGERSAGHQARMRPSGPRRRRADRRSPRQNCGPSPCRRSGSRQPSGSGITASRSAP
jgi:Bifunctional DNA primase/polymerase, N-terminal